MSIEKLLFLMGLAWLSDMFFGMGIEQKLLEPLRSKKQSKNGNGGRPKPLPMTEIKLGYSFKTASQEWPLHVRSENDKAIWVIVGVNNVAFPPNSNSLKHKTLTFEISSAVRHRLDCRVRQMITRDRKHGIASKN